MSNDETFAWEDYYNDLEIAVQALNAIRARINGEWDNPDLLLVGPMTTDYKDDIIHIVEQAIENMVSIRSK